MRRLTLLAALLSPAALLPVIFAAGPGIHPPRRMLSPAESQKTFVVPEDLALDQVLHEPTVAQPVSISFDERGRMWVVQYRQYPDPAGLTAVSHDRWWRAVYDKVPPPPPNHFKGKDRITIHEDTDGDGVFDKHTTFVDELNITTAAVRGRGGVWVLNPPYLLFYPTKDNADQPTGPPEVHLEGFGLEDTHSVANSLRWGPDGWLYAAQGSTVTGNIKRPGSKDPPVHSEGQHIWRYHPETRRYEIFAEGGGNAFGVEIDAQGRIFSGHNGGNTRGFHYVQGGYYRKGFDKHGPLSNPYTFGFFEAMKSSALPRFSHTFLLYEAKALPERYRGKLFAVSPLQHQVIVSEVSEDTSSLKTKDVGVPVNTSDEWFRPVDVKLGPDGAVYVADWHDNQVAHYRAAEGFRDQETGRVYRLRTKDAKPTQPFDLNKKTTDELIDLLGHENKWFRQTALRLIGDRKDAKVIPRLKKQLAESRGQLALETLWALNLSGGLKETEAIQAMAHPEPAVRAWAVRLLCDDNHVSLAVRDAMVKQGRDEKQVAVRSQLACSARRLPAGDALAVLRPLLDHDEDTADVHLPLLLWWVVESKCDSDRDAVLRFFQEKSLWQRPLVHGTITARLMRRFAQTGTRKDLQACALLFKAAPDRSAGQKLLEGFEEAFKGRSMADLPTELLEEIAKLGGGSVALGVRQGKPQAIDEALTLIANPKGRERDRLEAIELFGEVKQPKAVPVLLKVAGDTNPVALRKASLASLSQYDGPEIAGDLVKLYPSLPEEVRAVAQSVLAGRKAWAATWLDAVEAEKIDKATVPVLVVRQLLALKDDALTKRVNNLWGDVKGATTAEVRQEIDRLTKVLNAGTGSPYPGKKLYMQHCGNCHTLHGKGGNVGPDLTTYRRDDLNVMLMSVVNPSAEVREGYEQHVVNTESGRLVSGLLVEKDNRGVVLRTAEGQRVTIRKDDIADMRVAGTSLMPEGLLKPLTDQEVRDLFAYLRSTQPLNDGQ